MLKRVFAAQTIRQSSRLLQRSNLFSRGLTRSFYHTESKPTPSLLEFVRKNQIIPQKLQAIAEATPDSLTTQNVKKLLNAINEGNFIPEGIFSNPECELYLHHLHATQQITTNQWLSTYNYLITLMQFTPYQNLKAEHANLKSIRTVKTLKLVNDKNEITEDGKTYLKKLCTRFATRHLELDLEKIHQYVKSLPPSEQIVISISYDPKLKKSRVEEEINFEIIAFAGDTAFVELDNWLGEFKLGSMSLLQYILREMSKTPLEPYPIIGKIGDAKLTTLHAAHKHPYPIYSQFARDNTVKVTYQSGPVPTLCHDIAHLVLGSVLTSEERDRIFKRYIPVLEKQRANSNSNDEIENINRVIIGLSDLDTAICTDPKNYFKDFIKYYLKVDIEKFYAVFKAEFPGEKDSILESIIRDNLEILSTKKKFTL